MRTGPALALAALLSAACSEDPPPPAPTPEPAAPAEPVIPGLDALSAVSPGRASAALPAWDAEHARFDHAVRDLPAKLGRGENVLQVLVGDRPETGAMLTYYGEALPPGSYPCLGYYAYTFTQAKMAQHGFTPGDDLYGQFWSRDSGFAPPNNVGLTAAMHAVILP